MKGLHLIDADERRLFFLLQHGQAMIPLAKEPSNFCRLPELRSILKEILR